MRKYLIIILSLFIMNTCLKAQPHVTRIGRWGEGYCESIFKRSGYTFVGNGAYLEVYKMVNNEYQKLHEILMPATVRDLWVKSDLTYIYSACGRKGLQIVSFDPGVEEFIRITGSIDTEGFSNGLIQFGSFVYIADGSNGMQIVDVGNPFNPIPRGKYPTAASAHEIWVANDSTALVAADSAGLYAIKITDPYYPSLIDLIGFQSIFPGFSARAYSVIKVDTVAYVSTGHGGMFTVDMRNPSNMQILGRWTDTVPVDVRHTWISGTSAYLACGEDGFYGPIDVSNPVSPGPLPFLPLDTEGVTLDIVVSQDTAYICDGSNGQLMLNVNINNPPTLLDSIDSADKSYDVTISGNYVYTATGKTGLKVFNFNFETNRPDSLHLNVVGTYDTPGEARGIAKQGNFAYVADGSQGLLGLDASDPNDLSFQGQYTFPGDTCYRVDVPAGSKAYAACGAAGYRIINISGTYFQLGIEDTPGDCRDIKVQNDTAFVADMTGGVRIYNVFNPVNTILLQSYTINMEAWAVDVSGSQVFVANGDYGILIWTPSTGSVYRIETEGKCTDIDVKEKTIYATVVNHGLRIYDFSLPGQYPLAGYYNTGEYPYSIMVDDNSGKLCVADGKDGLYILKSTITPDIAISPSVLNFGAVPTDYSRPLIVWVYNTGSTELKINRIIPNKSEFKFSESSFSIAPGDTHRLEVRFEPTNLTPVGVPYLGSASIQSNADTLSISLQGEVQPLTAEGPFEPDYFTIALYHFDEMEGNAVDDASNNSIDGTTQGSTSRSETAKYGRSLYFDGENSWVEVPYASLLNFRDTTFTVEFWFWMNQKPVDKYILLRRGDYASNNRQYEITLEEGNRGLTGSVWTGTTSPIQHEVISGSLAELNIEQWYHVALTWDGDSLRLYLNDVLKSKKQVHGSLINEVDESLAIGASSNAEASFNGFIDEVHISSVARQPWEFHVNRSRLIINRTTLEFGDVLLNYIRRVPFILTNGGTQPLSISSINSSNEYISISDDDGFILGVEDRKTIWVTYQPGSEEILDTEDFLSIYSSDPTFPVYNLPLNGQVITTLPAGPYDTDPFTLGLYHMDEALGTTLYDSSGYEMDGALFGTLLQDDLNRKFGSGRSLRFDSNDDIIVITPQQDHYIGPEWGGLSAEGWFYFSTLPVAGNSILINRGVGLSKQFKLFVDFTGTVTAEVYNTSAQAFEVSSTGSTPIQTGQWYHMASSLTQDTLRLFINGSEVDETPITGSLAGSIRGTAIDTLSIILGRDWNGEEAFTGNMDEIRISGIGRERWEFNVVMARLELSPTELDFGKVLLERDRELKLWVKNPGIDILVVDSISSSRPTLVFTDTSSFYVAPEDSQLVRVTYRPENLSPMAGQLTFWTNDPFWQTRPMYFEGQVLETKPSGSYTPDPFSLALYHFNEGTGTSVEDTSGGSSHGILHGNVSWTENGRFSNALQFNGLEDWVEIPHTSALDFQNADFSLEVWFSMIQKPQNYSSLMKRGNGSTAQFELMLGSADNIGLMANVWDIFGEQYTLYTGSMSELNVDQWYHAALMWDGDSLYLSLNNIIRDRILLPYPLRNIEEEPLLLGGSDVGNNPYSGYLDEPRISNILREPWDINVVDPTIQAFPIQIHFATVLVDQSRTLQLYVKNDGDQDLRISNIVGAEGVFTMPEELAAFTLSRLQTTQIPITYTPNEVNITHTAELTITSNDTMQPITIIFLEGSGSESTIQQQYTNDTHTLALYHCDGIPGDTTIADASSSGYIGYLRNSVSFAINGFFGSGLRFNGDNGYVEIPSNEFLSFDLNQESFTIECFFRTDTISQALLYKGFEDTLYSPNYGIYINKYGRLSITGFGDGGQRVSDGSWHHLAFTYNHITSEGRLYLDGTMQWLRLWDPPDGDVLNRPLIIGAIEETLGNFRDYFQGDIDEMRISDIPREPWEFQLVDFGVEVTSILPEIVNFQEGLTFTIYVPYGLASAGISLLYRPGGGNIYQRLAGTQLDTVTYEIEIPPESISLRGLEYYIEVYVNNDTLTHPIMDPRSNPIAEIVRHEGEMEAPISFHFQQFKMFSIPFGLDVSSALSVLEDDLGPYDPYKWRLSWWQRRDSVYVHYTNTTPQYFVFDPGRAYWITTDQERKFDIHQFQTVTTDTSFSIDVYAGWNMISNPFNFPVLWNDCTVSSDSVFMLTYYDPNENGYNIDWPILEPWHGYWIYNSDQDSIPEKIYILPREGSIEKTSPVNNGILTDLEEEEWLIRLSANSIHGKDLDNFAGIRHTAKEEWDIKDRPEPPPIGEYITLHFDHSNWKTHAGTYAADMRQPDQPGYVYPFVVETRYEKSDIHVSWNFLQNLPDEWEAYIFDLKDGISIDCRKENILTYKTEAMAPNVRYFKLVVGSEEFIKQQNEGIPLEPVYFHLYQNYPNPFNLETTIKYSIPKNDHVKIAVYNALGQMVRLILNENVKTGHHEIIWDGQNENHKSVSSGIYIYQIKTSDNLKTRKMVIIK